MSVTRASVVVPQPRLAPPRPAASTTAPHLTNGLAGVRLESIESFVVLSDELHFTNAARRLHLSQPGLSRRIALLERQVGAALVQRSTRSVQLTPAGEALLPYARRLLVVATEAQVALA